MAKLRNWAIVGGLKMTTGGEERMSLLGRVFEHRRFEDGETVRSAPIVCVEGDAIVTKTGTVYHLDGPPDPAFLDFYRSRPEKNPNHPLAALIDRAITRAHVIV